MADPGQTSMDSEILRLLAEDAGLAALELDARGAVVGFGPAAAGLFQLSGAALRGRPFPSLLAPEIRDEAGALLEEARAGRVRREALLQRGDGTLVPAQLFLAAQRRNGKGPAGASFLLVLRDLGDKQRIEAQVLRLRERERAASAEAERQRERLDALLAETPALVVITRGAEHVVLFASHRVRHLLPNREIAGRRLREALPELDGQGILDAADDVFGSGRPFSGRELRVKMLLRPGKPDREGWFDLLCRPTRDRDGRIDGVLLFAVEVTQQVKARRRAEAAAQVVLAQQAWFEAVLDLMPAPLLLLDGGGARVAFANRAAAASLGAVGPGASTDGGVALPPLTDAEGRPVPPSEQPGPRATRGERIEALQLDAHLADGSARSLLFSAAPLPAMHGHAAAVALSFLDVTALKRMEGQLQRAVAARDEFLSIASHELRTPLTSLQLELQSLQRRLSRGEGLAADELARGLETGLRQVGRLTKLVHSLLDISRLTAGRIDLELAPVDLAEVAREVTARQVEEAARAGCTLSFSGDGPVVGRWDRLRLEQIASNLISNAIKYGAGQPVEVEVEYDAAKARLRVSDGGIGIAREDQARIFDRFERAVSERHYGGFGLGLWIVRQIVHALQGGISVQSEPGQGATFVVELPRGTGPAAGAP